MTKLTVGTRIYYTGDMANTEAFGTIIQVAPCDWYGSKIVIEFDAKYEKPNSTITPHAFASGPGCRFMTADDYNAKRKAAYDRLVAQLASRKAVA